MELRSSCEIFVSIASLLAHVMQSSLPCLTWISVCHTLAVQYEIEKSMQACLRVHLKVTIADMRVTSSPAQAVEEGAGAEPDAAPEQLPEASGGADAAPAAGVPTRHCSLQHKTMFEHFRFCTISS